EVVRFYILSTHYRSPLDFDDTKLEMNRKSLARLHNVLDNTEALLKNVPFGTNDEAWDNHIGDEIDKLRRSAEKAKQDFREAMDDDFNTALAIAGLFDLAREANAFGKILTEETAQAMPAQVKEVLQEVQRTFLELGEVLGLFEQRGLANQEDSGLVEELMALIIEIRREARAKKDWATADTIRNNLGEIGIILEDTPQGVRWKRK
ncbi:MAG: cysteine--tRNA ligase, partial [Firmicutes bacterium]|nr:cysteine--tRNA ligase [Bacillota bacterium]